MWSVSHSRRGGKGYLINCEELADFFWVLCLIICYMNVECWKKNPIDYFFYTHQPIRGRKNSKSKVGEPENLKMVPVPVRFHQFSDYGPGSGSGSLKNQTDCNAVYP
jgi:hypothetical protein